MKHKRKYIIYIKKRNITGDLKATTTNSQTNYIVEKQF